MASARYAAPAVDFVSAYARAAAEFLAAIPSGDMAARVPACPGWSTYDLVVHLGNVHAWAATIVETGARAPEQNDHPPSHRPKAVARWYAAKAEDLYQVLRDADGDAACWTFSAAHHTEAFWPRRQTHETLVHLVDLHQASGSTPEVPAVLAADGIAEVLEVFLPRMHERGRPADLVAPTLVHAADTGDTWLLSPSAEGPPEVSRVDGADLVERGADLLAGPAADLMMMLWKRLPADHTGASLDGDRDRLLALLRSPLTP
jgi:uncharacterized protein (TIGR03083 family)